MPHSPDELRCFIESLYMQHKDALTKQGKYEVGHERRFFPVVEDCVQEVFIDADKSSEKLMNHPNPAAWLRRVMKHKIAEHMGSERKHHPKADVDAVAAPAVSQTEDDDIEAFLSREENKTMVRNLFHLLKENEQQLLKARYWECKPLAQIAREQGKSVSNMKVQLHRIITKLKKIFSGLPILLTFLLFWPL